MAVLITGGAGYIGSHAAVEFLNNDRDIIILDNFILFIKSNNRYNTGAKPIKRQAFII